MSVVVIFRAVQKTDDPRYLETAMRLRDLALGEFGCTEFLFLTDPHGHEVALSYWPDEASIKRWKAQADHLNAQQLGRTQWYSSYRIQVATITRDYGMNV